MHIWRARIGVEVNLILGLVSLRSLACLSLLQICVDDIQHKQGSLFHEEVGN